MIPPVLRLSDTAALKKAMQNARKLPSQREAEKWKKIEMQREAERIAEIIKQLMALEEDSNDN